MKQTIFENKQRADELIQEAIRIWRESDHPDQLEGIQPWLISRMSWKANWNR